MVITVYDCVNKRRCGNMGGDLREREKRWTNEMKSGGSLKKRDQFIPLIKTLRLEKMTNCLQLSLNCLGY